MQGGGAGAEPPKAEGQATCGGRAQPARREEATPSAPTSAERERRAGGADAGYRRRPDANAKGRAEGQRREGCRNHATTAAETAEESAAVRCAPLRRDVQQQPEHLIGRGYGAAP